MRKVFRYFYNLVLTLLGLLIVIVGATLIPIPGNFRAFVVQSGSMEPAVGTGSLIFVKPSASYEVGNIVNIKDGKNSVTHRIVGKSMEGGSAVFTTKGDANEEADPEEIPADRIFGKMIWGMPFLGYPVGYAKTKVGFIFLVVVPAVVIIYDELQKIGREIRKKVDLRKKRKTGKNPDETDENRTENILTINIEPEKTASSEEYRRPSQIQKKPKETEIPRKMRKMDL